MTEGIASPEIWNQEICPSVGPGRERNTPRVKVYDNAALAAMPALVGEQFAVFPLARRGRMGGVGAGRCADWARRSARLAHAAFFMSAEEACGEAKGD
jgi:hypothetical protein